jgi:lactaldehyde reductase
MSLGALMGGIALQAKMVYGHSIGYTIAARYRLPHGVSCAVPLPYIISNYSIACAPKMKALGEAFGVGTTGEDSVEIGRSAAEKAKEISLHLRIPTTMSELGVKEGELSSLAKECIEMYPRSNSPLVFDERSMVHFYRMIWEGKLST